MREIFDKNLTKDGVILAVSGGADSMTLLSLAINEIPDKIEVVTVNHHLRRTAEKDVKLVRDFCEKNSVPCVAVDVYPEEFARENGFSTETAARILRYDALNILADGKPICLAHNKNDQAETVLMHIIRGSGNRGAVGMKEKGEYYRPLLNFTRKEIMDYVKTGGIPYATDKTNFDNRYARNYVRNKILPELEKINSGAVGNLAKFAEIRGADEDYFSAETEKILPALNIKIGGGGAEISDKVFCLHPALKNRILIRIFNMLGYKKDVEQIHLSELDALSKNKSGKKLCLPFDLVAVRGYNGINILPADALNKKNYGEMPFRAGEITLGGRVVEISEKDGGGLRFDIDKIPDGTVLRFRRNGDFFTKFGGGTKKLKDYFIDKKIPLINRDSIPLLAFGSEILLVFGVEISDKIKIGGDTERAFYAKIIM